MIRLLVLFFVLSGCQRVVDSGAFKPKEKEPEVSIHVPPVFFKKVAASYDEVKAGCIVLRKKLWSNYQNAASDSLRQQTLTEARQVFTQKLVNDIIPFWYGTAWDFDGYTADPGKGTIACGYFVSTTLFHAGLKVNRYKLAQQGPYDEARSINLSDEVLTLSDLAIEDLKPHFDGLENGLYFAGLDFHVGYLYKADQRCYFIHSNYYNAEGVTIERVETSMAFKSTTTYYIAPITTNDGLILKWLANEETEVKTGGAL
jgi:hypothetical protein